MSGCALAKAAGLLLSSPWGLWKPLPAHFPVQREHRVLLLLGRGTPWETHPPAPDRPATQGPGQHAQPLSTAHPPLALGKVLLNLEADRWIDVPVQGCVPVNPSM